MDTEGFTLIDLLMRVALLFTLVVTCLWCLVRIVRWAKGMPKGAYLVMAIFPLLSLFPIPPPVFKNVAKAKQEQRKRQADPGDPPES
ncbi:hypothetical protein [Pseudoalteromonas rubra]|uniref:hypothetical protein n=1 Tax=Pseudoalteromonas rubra TaxID=43658 RepID=UPI00148714B8|nr:hypothetical protein [Pseudoalteromonas rubra]